MHPIPTIAFIGLAMAGPAAAEPALKALEQPAHCRDDPRMHWARPGKPPGIHKLTELPPARAYYPMLERGADGCFTPVLFGTRNGAPRGNGARPAPIVPRTFP